MKRNIFSIKRLLIAYSFGFLPFALVLAILSLLKISPVYFNENAYEGIQGFFVAILLVPFFGIIMTGVNWMFLNFGEFLYFTVSNLFRRKKGQSVE